MTQEQLKEQFLQYAENNLNNQTVLESITILLDNISNELYEEGYISESNKITSSMLIIKKMLEEYGEHFQW